jgi:hypothetical protein
MACEYKEVQPELRINREQERHPPYTLPLPTHSQPQQLFLRPQGSQSLHPGVRMTSKDEAFPRLSPLTQTDILLDTVQKQAVRLRGPHWHFPSEPCYLESAVLMTVVNARPLIRVQGFEMAYH